MVACTPHPGLGTVAIQRPALVEVVDLGTCRTTTERPPAAAAGPRSVGRTIVFHGKVVVRATQPLESLGASPGGRWVIYAIDAYGSASLAADGLPFYAVPATSGKPVALGAGLVYPDYRTWCDFRTLVMTVGVSRMAVDNKRLILFGAPDWLGRNLEPHAYATVFGSVTCAPDGNSIVVQKTAQSTKGAYRQPHWSLWRVELPGGTMTRLTNPPAGWEDDSPHFSPDQRTIYFVRARNGNGSLYALRDGKIVGPLLSLGHEDAYFGHTAWPYSVRR